MGHVGKAQVNRAEVNRAHINQAGAPMADGAMRIDKLLWFLRLAPTRTHASAWVAEGHMRLNRRRIDRASALVKPGDVLVLPTLRGVRVIEIAMLPTRRGPAQEAQECYRVLDETRQTPLAAGQSLSATVATQLKGDLQP